MEIGTYGKTVFEVSTDRVRTFGQLERTGEARFAEHVVQGTKPILQFLGPGLDEVGLDIRLDAALGVNPLSEIDALREVRDTGGASSLMVGGKVLGKFVLINVTETWRTVDGLGALLLADVSLKLKEYADGV